MQPTDIIDFWRDSGPEKWFTKNPDFDNEINERFLFIFEKAAAGGLDAWSDTAEGTLALTIVLDQFSRNLFRGTAAAFATDPLARAIAGAAIDHGYEEDLGDAELQFLYMPFMHSENLDDQKRSLAFFEGTDAYRYASNHHDLIARFGRFPHRNKALGRDTLPEEEAAVQKGEDW